MRGNIQRKAKNNPGSHLHRHYAMNEQISTIIANFAPKALE
ncbi:MULTISPECIES: hypothetical protein [Pseudomonas]|nr:MULTISPECIES: hypothetical protein [Pseudomonas]